MAVKTIAGGIAVAGALGLATLGMGSSVASAAPSAGPPQVTSTQDVGRSGGDAPGWAAPSPYAAYGGGDMCAMPGMYFVNICS